MEFIKNYLERYKEELKTIELEEVKKVVDLLYEARKQGKQVFIMGNGGSASTASHFACDLSKGTLDRVYHDNRKRFRVMSLTDNVATITAFSNDLSYDEVFAQQLKNLVQEGDVVIAITGSGNSENVVRAVNLAKQHKANTMAFLGFDGGRLKNLVDHYILVRSNHYGIIEDAHSFLTHLISSYLIEKIRNDSK